MNIQLVRTSLKILAALVSVAILWLGWSYVLYLGDEAVRCDTLTLNGDINSHTFIEARQCLVRSTAAKKTFVVKASGGGDAFAALALGMLIHQQGWDVEVVDYCASSCAIFIFPAGKTKYLHRHSMLLFHGGPYQRNLLDMAEAFDQAAKTKGAPAESVTLGRVNQEGTFSFTPGKSKAHQEVIEFLSMTSDPTAAQLLAEMRSASDQFYGALGVNPLLSTHGQVGAYELLYKSDKYGGFTYPLESLRRLGIRNIELKDGEWQPQRNPVYQGVYEVTYP
jgi:hypothetical protein